MVTFDLIFSFKWIIHFSKAKTQTEKNGTNCCKRLKDGFAQTLTCRSFRKENWKRSLDYAAGIKTLGCQKIADVFNTGKNAATNILKNKKKIWEQYDKFSEKNKTCNQSEKYKIINNILYDWYQKCYASNFHPTGLLLREEAMEIKTGKTAIFYGFAASDGWLDK